MAARAPSGRGAATSAADRLVALKRQFPCREATIDLLAAELARGDSLGTNCLVYGPAATGKTTVVRGLLSALCLRHAYINCHEASRVRPLLCSLLHQLKGGKRQRDELYEAATKCDSLADFHLQLPGVVGRRCGPCWLVLDNVQRLAGSELLAAVMRTREDTGVQVAVLLVASGGAWASGRFLRDTMAALPPKEIQFAAYSPGELQKILEHQQQHQQQGGDGGSGDALAFSQFLTAFVPTFCRASNNLLDLQAAVAHLFPLYMQPLRDGRQLQSQQLYGRIKGQVQECIRDLHLQQHHAPTSQAPTAAVPANYSAAATAAASAAVAVDQRTAAGRKASSSELSFELPYVSKFLLLAAYVASRNKPTSDRAVFDPSHKRRGRRDAQAHDRQVEAAVEAKLRGPHSFPLERLLHIFYALYAQHDAEDEDQEGEGQEGRQLEEAQRMMQQAEVLQQVSSLVALRLLEQCSGDVLEGQLYRCNLGEAAAATLGSNVRLRLGDYLRLG